MKGLIVAALSVAMLITGAYFLREASPSPGLQHLHPFLYYWFCFTVLTGIWEFCFVAQYSKIADYAGQMICDKQHVWLTSYPFYYILPNFMSYIFYAEYAAWADREYMNRNSNDFWSRLIESSHALFCGVLSLATLVLAFTGNHEEATVCAMYAMGGQFMNSILYMGQYAIQCRNPDCANFSSNEFPLGCWMSKRPFMWVNLPWMLFPSIIFFWQLLAPIPASEWHSALKPIEAAISAGDSGFNFTITTYIVYY